MLTRMTERTGAVVLEVFRGCLSCHGDKGRDDRMFLEAMHHFAVHTITRRALPPGYGTGTASRGSAGAACSRRSSRLWRI